MPHYVYRIYDEADILLYVGEAKDAEHRLRLHSTNHAIFIYQAARIDITEYTSTEEAKAAEVEAIQTENPRYNRRSGPPTDPAIAQVFRDAIHLYLETGLLGRSADLLNKHGVRTRTGGWWTYRTLLRAMDSGRLRSLVSDEEWATFKWIRSLGLSPRTIDSPYLLSGLVYCPCGTTRSVGNYGTVVTFVCPRDNGPCDRPWVHLSLLEPVVLATVPGVLDGLKRRSVFVQRLALMRHVQRVEVDGDCVSVRLVSGAVAFGRLPSFTLSSQHPGRAGDLLVK